jgi:uncharacterized membrane protein YeaQ/YmgE (transglycosylase-associated protein family)
LNSTAPPELFRQNRIHGARGGGAGFVINLIVGIIGGFLGGWLVGLWGWIAVGTFGTLLTSVAGAIILLLIVSLFTRRRPAND